MGKNGQKQAKTLLTFLMCGMVPKMCGMVPKMCGIRAKMCGMVLKM